MTRLLSNLYDWLGPVRTGAVVAAVAYLVLNGPRLVLGGGPLEPLVAGLLGGAALFALAGAVVVWLYLRVQRLIGG